MSTSIADIKGEMRDLITATQLGTLTEAQGKRFDVLADQLKAAQEREKAVAEGEALVKAMAGAEDVRPDAYDTYTAFNEPTGEDGRGFTITRESLAKSARFLSRKSIEAARVKGVSNILPGSTLASPILHDGIVPLGKDTQSFLGLLETKTIDGRHYSFARQTAFTNNAAVVAPGELKPTSSIGVELVSGETKVIAHLSNEIDEMLLRDVTGLDGLIGTELLYGLHAKLEEQAVSGDGETELLGILNTPGVQTQAYATDALTTIRTAITKLRVAGYQPGAIAMNYTDWQALELLRTEAGEGSYLLNANSPINSTTRTLWGVQVVESAAVPAGTVVVMETGAAKVYVSQPGIMLAWHVSGEAFERNTTRTRVEMRANVVVEKPAAIVKATIAGA